MTPLKTLLSILLGLSQTSEFQMKAAYLSNFAQFVEWQGDVLKTPDSPINLCVFSGNPVGPALATAIAGKSVNEHPLRVVYLSDPRQIPQCQIVFVGKADKKALKVVLDPDALGSGVLTVGESEKFAANGGMIEFKSQQGELRFEINLKAVEQAQIQISSKLLSLAEVVRK